jgi:signal peptidase II
VKRSYTLLFGVAGAIVALDQWSKQQATLHLAYREPIRVVGELVRLTYARNSGIAFSLFAGRGLPLWVFSLVAAIAVVVLFSRHVRLSLGRQLALACILGGAIGNLIDRVSTGLVVDFILLSWGRHEFPVFNVADVAVTCGVSLFALTWTRDDDPAESAEPTDAPLAAPADAHEVGEHEQDGGADGAGRGSGAAGGSLAREGEDRPLA